MTSRIANTRKPRPEDFTRCAEVMCKTELQRHYACSTELIERWLDEAGITAAVYVRRMRGTERTNAQRIRDGETTLKCGHPINEDNVRLSDTGKVRCRECSLAQQAASRKRSRGSSSIYSLKYLPPMAAAQGDATFASSLAIASRALREKILSHHPGGHVSVNDNPKRTLKISPTIDLGTCPRCGARRGACDHRRAA